MIKRSLNFCLLAALFALILCPSQASHAALAKSAVLETNVAYLRVDQTDKNLPEEISSALRALQSTNAAAIAGIVLDLRFATSGDADDLKPAENVLEGARLPMAILVNTQTRGGAAQLAEELREADAGLVFGAPVDNLQPDISVSVSASDEKKFLKNPYAVPTTNTDTNLLSYVDIDHTTEADLVREKIKDGDEAPVDDDNSQSAAGDAAQRQKPFIRDPVLARGLDFIKGVVALRLANKQG